MTPKTPSQPPQPTPSGKLNDPLFLFMLAAVLLALGSSFMLRAVVQGFAPPTAQASVNGPDDNNPLHNASEDAP